MKKVVALLLAVLMVFPLAACKEEEKVPPTSPNATTESDPTEETKPKEGVYKRDSYSVSDSVAFGDREKVVATVGTGKLTNGVLQIRYWMGVMNFLSSNGVYLPYLGLDYTKPLDTQSFRGEDGTWQHYFLEDALGVWHTYQALALQAAEDGVPVDPDTQKLMDTMSQTLEERREKEGFATIDEMIRYEAGPGSTAEDFLAYQDVFYRSYSYYNHLLTTTTFTDAEVEKWFEDNKDGLESKGITKETIGYDVRHILVEVAEGKTDEDWSKCEAAAQALLDQWLAGEATEESFAAMAKEHSADPGSKDNGGLYEDLTKDTNFVEPFKTWYLDESRKAGDYGLVKSDYGYHIMYFSDSGAMWQDYCRNAMTDNAVTERVNQIVEAHPITIHYENVSLGVVDLSKKSES